jgi:hypothetical protein
VYEDETYEMESIKPLRHDRWSVLIVGLSHFTEIASVTANTLNQFTMMAAQHANQKKIDKRFDSVIEPLKMWGR